MKPLIALAAALAFALPAAADDGAERARIRTERDAVEARFKQQEKACYGRFAVTDCIQKAQRERNAMLADLRRQERVLNEADRRRRAAERQQALEERNSPQARQRAEEKRQQALQEHQAREARAAEEGRKRKEDQAERAARAPRPPGQASGPPGPQGSPRPVGTPKPPRLTPEEAAKNRAAHEARLKAAEEHNAKLRDRIARRKKPAASDLPVPQ